jgi:hypothetical protein
MNVGVREIINPFTFAWELFYCPPRDDDWITGVGYARSILGTLLIIFFCLPYMTVGQTAGGLMDNWYDTSLVAGAVTVAAALPLSVISSRMGRVYFRKFGWQAPCRAVAYCGGVALFFYLGIDDDWWVRSPLVVIIPFLLFWLLIFVTIGVFLNASFVFGAGETHPKLAPIVTAATTSILGVRSLMTTAGAATPKPVTLLIVISGVVSTLLLAIIELSLLSKRGYKIRQAPKTYKRAEVLHDSRQSHWIDHKIVGSGQYFWFNEPEGYLSSESHSYGGSDPLVEDVGPMLREPYSSTGLDLS